MNTLSNPVRISKQYPSKNHSGDTKYLSLELADKFLETATYSSHYSDNRCVSLKQDNCYCAGNGLLALARYFWECYNTGVAPEDITSYFERGIEELEDNIIASLNKQLDGGQE